jgi:hypothetical protein
MELDVYRSSRLFDLLQMLEVDLAAVKGAIDRANSPVSDARAGKQSLGRGRSARGRR